MINRRCFITGVKGTSLSKKEQVFLKRYKPWGVIIFSRNIVSLSQVKKLITKIKKIFNDRHYPIMIDQEGGRVNRLRKFFNSDNLTNEYFGKLYLEDKKKFNKELKNFIDKTSNMLRYIGANINTVPVLDLRVKGSANIIGNRSFSDNPQLVSKIGNIFIKRFHANKISTVIKHIPGHGLAKVDSHNFTPTISKKYGYLLKNDFSTFKNKKSFFAMTAHIVYKDVDSKNTATHSKKLINIIRKKIKFKKILISDDISMKSLKFSIKENTKKAFSSGCNLVLHCNGNYNEMVIVAENSPKLSKFIIKKTSQFTQIIS